MIYEGLSVVAVGILNKGEVAQAVPELRFCYSQDCSCGAQHWNIFEQPDDVESLFDLNQDMARLKVVE